MAIYPCQSLSIQGPLEAFYAFSESGDTTEPETEPPAPNTETTAGELQRPNNENRVMLTLLWFATEVVIMTVYATLIEGKFGIMATMGYPWRFSNINSSFDEISPRLVNDDNIVITTTVVFQWEYQIL